MLNSQGNYSRNNDFDDLLWRISVISQFFDQTVKFDPRKLWWERFFFQGEGASQRLEGVLVNSSNETAEIGMNVLKLVIQEGNAWSGLVFHSQGNWMVDHQNGRYAPRLRVPIWNHDAIC